MEKITDKNLAKNIIGSIGIIYGDIGTSPLYALESCFHLAQLSVTRENILGIISLFVWLLTLIVSIKYISIVMRCHQQGEGGVLILSSLCKQIKSLKIKKIAVALGIAGVALFVGDSVITPAISVLSAVEGVGLIANISEHHIVMLAVLILSVLFSLQRYGSGIIGNYFGYIMLTWFLVLGMLGLNSIVQDISILEALNPLYAVTFIINNKIMGIVIIGGSILVVSGVEALYADMGHFGRKSVTLSWMLIVFPALCLNYLGQGSLLLRSPESIDNVFYLLTPSNLMFPMIILSIIATIIASQAVISGLFSLSWQAIMLHYIPRMRIFHTSFEQIGQVYVPVVNYILFVLTISAVIIFRNSQALSYAYGLSVAMVMMMSSILVTILAYYQWHWSKLKIAIIFAPLLLLDIVFVLSNLVKIIDGAWFTLMIAALVLYVIAVWRNGNAALNNQRIIENKNLNDFIKQHIKTNIIRIPGCAVFMTRNSNTVPSALRIHLKHNKYLHEKLLFISIQTLDIVKVKKQDQFIIEKNFDNIFSIQARYGFDEVPDLNKVISMLKSLDILDANEEISFFLSRGLAFSNQSCISSISKKLYIFLSKNSLPAYEFYKIDYHNVLELGIMYKI